MWYGPWDGPSFLIFHLFYTRDNYPTNINSYNWLNSKFLTDLMSYVKLLMLSLCTPSFLVPIEVSSTGIPYSLVKEYSPTSLLWRPSPFFLFSVLGSLKDLFSHNRHLTCALQETKEWDTTSVVPRTRCHPRVVYKRLTYSGLISFGFPMFSYLSFIISEDVVRFLTPVTRYSSPFGRLQKFVSSNKSRYFIRIPKNKQTKPQTNKKGSTT